MSGKGRKIFRQIAACYITSLFICFLDQFLKFHAEKLLRSGDSRPVIENFLHLTLVHNTGAAFGSFGDRPGLFVIISVISVIFITVFLAYRADKLGFLEKSALCFILGGAAGNLIDRVHLGYVIDFIDLRVWPVFNLADSFITIGAVMLIFSMMPKRTAGVNK